MIHTVKDFSIFSEAAAAAAKSLQSCLTVRLHRRQPTRLPCPWDSPGKNTGVGCHFLLQCMKVEVDVFFYFPCFFYDLAYVGSLISCSSAFSKSSLYIWKFSVHVLLKPHVMNFEYSISGMWSEWNCMVIWTLFGIAFLWDWNKNWPFPVCWVSHICWPSEYSTLTSSSLGFEITRIPSPPLALFAVMLPMAHWTSRSKMSGSRWVTPRWLSGS